jgi:hypothetical protein
MSVSTANHAADRHTAFPAFTRTLSLDIAAALSASSALLADPRKAQAAADQDAPAPPPPSPVEWDAAALSDDERIALATGRKT